ncbi:MAG: hypothetical protein H6526_08945 [Actinobacteria bacterium]|nr:hypothetical protein [Actinomycetota bacterium]
MSAEVLFPLPSDSIAVTSDDCYTPRWVFDAMGLHFDLDVAAPPGGPWHVPCDRYYTAEDDGLTQPWDGLVWCNPPYSRYAPWAARWASHARGVLVGLAAARSPGRRDALRAADVVAFIDPKFERAGLPPRDIPQAVFVAFRGVGTEPAERLAAADPYGAVLYGRPTNPSPATDPETGRRGGESSDVGAWGSASAAGPDAASPP